MRGPSFLSAAAVIAIATVCATGCSRDNTPDTVSATKLQSGLADKLAQSGTPANWVYCPKPLPSQVGARARCDVTFNYGDSVTAVLTTVRVDGGQVEWEISEAQLSKDQLRKRVSAMVGNSGVDCDSGVNGRVGSWVTCRATQDGVTRKEVVEVTQVKGLTLTLKVTPYLLAKQVEERVGSELIPVYGRAPDRTACEGDLPGTVGSAIKCAATYGDKNEIWTVKVTGVSGGVINFTVTRPSSRQEPLGVPVGDQCRGCPG